MRGKRFAAAWFAALVAAAPAGAIEPETREAIVLHDRVWDGFAYVENFVPSEAGEVVILADSDNALLYVETLEYFWPLSREVYVAFDTRREELPGTIVISADGRTVAEVALDSYAIVYPEGAHKAGARMVWGEAAEAAYRDFTKAMSDYNRAFSAAQRDKARYHQALLAAAEERLRDGQTRPVPPPLPDPEPVRGSVTEPRAGFRVSLPAGTYEIALVREGVPVPGTEKRLRVVAVDSLAAVTADVIPEERWTRILASNGPDDRIFAGDGVTFYLTLNDSHGFDDATYRRITRPQSAGVEGLRTWVRRQPHERNTIDIRWNGGQWTPLARAGYKVEQTQGRNLGYVIRPAGEGENPDLSAFAITVPEGGADRAELRLPPAAGSVAADWTREIVIVRPSPGVLVWGLALAPVAFGAGLAAYRRRHRFRGARP